MSGLMMHLPLNAQNQGLAAQSSGMCMLQRTAPDVDWGSACLQPSTCRQSDVIELHCSVLDSRAWTACCTAYLKDPPALMPGPGQSGEGSIGHASRLL